MTTSLPRREALITSAQGVALGEVACAFWPTIILGAAAAYLYDSNCDDCALRGAVVGGSVRTFCVLRFGVTAEVPSDRWSRPPCRAC